ncbi:ABC transporter ATP-binding protein, partial [Enterococcus faecium]
NYSLITVSIFSNTTLVIGYVTLLLYTNLTLSIITFLLIPLQIWWISKSSSKIKK